MATENTERPTEADQSSAPSSSQKRKANLEQMEVDLQAPEPPSKRARRALKKGKTLPPKRDSDDGGDGDDGDEKDTKKKEGTKASVRSEHGVWIGNLSFTLTPAELKRWLVDNSGESITDESITRIHMPAGAKTTTSSRDREKCNKGFAYVDFKDIASKVAAIAMSEGELRARRLLIKDAKSYEGRPKKEALPERTPTTGEDGKDKGGATSETAVPASRKIFVGNLGFQATEDDVRDNFSKCGEIEFVKVATFEDSGKCKGYGWVKFRDAESAGWAVKGFVKIKEKIETEEDFIGDGANGSDESEEGGDDDEDEDEDEDEQEDKAEKETKKKKNTKLQQSEPKYQTRKWWVNRIAGRTLKIELAEDDQLRYKKRFGKGARRRQEADANGQKPQGRDGDDGADGGQENKTPAAEKELTSAEDTMAARRMGTAAKHTGTKITF